MADPNVRILYYRRSAALEDFSIMLGEVDIDKIPETHMEVYIDNLEIPEEPRKILENLFSLFNSENNPLLNDKEQKIIEDNRLHTSMSTGDIIKLGNGENIETWVCGGIGWEKLK